MTKGGHETVPVKCRLVGKRGKKYAQHTGGTAGCPASPNHLIHLGHSVPKEVEAKQGRTELFHHIKVRQ